MPKGKIKKGIKKLGTRVHEKEQEIKEKWRVPNNNLFLTSLIITIIFLLIELTNRIYDLYRTNPWVDIPSHFSAGIALGLIFLWVVSLTDVEYKKLTTLILVFVAKILWEVFEALQERVFYNPPYLKDYFIWDGAFDVLMGLCGASLVLLIIRKIKKGNRFLEDIDV